MKSGPFDNDDAHYLHNGSIDELTLLMNDTKKLARKIKDYSTNHIKLVIFLYYAGHGCLIDGDTHIITPGGDTYNLEKILRSI